jgi:hypothetical protein
LFVLVTNLNLSTSALSSILSFTFIPANSYFSLAVFNMIVKSQPSREYFDATLTADRGSSSRKNIVASTSKRVFFNLENNNVYANEQLVKNQVSALWYSRDEYKRFRRQKAKTVEHIRKAESSSPLSYYEVVTTLAYIVCCEASLHSIDGLSTCDKLHLVKCLDPDVLGLETYTSRAISRHRLERRVELYNIVSEGDIDLACEQIRADYEYISLASRLFAHELAMALAACVAADQREERRLLAYF